MHFRKMHFRNGLRLGPKGPRSAGRARSATASSPSTRRGPGCSRGRSWPAPGTSGRPRWRASRSPEKRVFFPVFHEIVYPFFFRRDALKEQFGKEPSTVRCLAVKSALLGTRHPRKEKEAALQNVTGEPACQYGKMLMTTQSEMEPSIKIEEMKSKTIIFFFHI